MTHRFTILLVAIVAAWSVVGCSSITSPGRCDLTIVALPADTIVEPGDSLPAAPALLAAPNDFDRTSIAIVTDDQGNPAVNMTLQGDAIARLAAHTAGHPGEFMAIAVNGTVVSVPVIQGPLLDGAIQITGAGGDDDLAHHFAGCVS